MALRAVLDKARKRDREHATRRKPTQREAEIRANYARDAAAANLRADAWARSVPGTPYGVTEVVTVFTGREVKP